MVNRTIPVVADVLVDKDVRHRRGEGDAGARCQELALVEEAVKTKLILDSVDAWLLSSNRA